MCALELNLGVKKKNIRKKVNVKIEDGQLCIASKFTLDWVTVSKSEIEELDGRNKIGTRIWEQGSYLYAAMDKNKKVLYVGETSKSIKKRFRSDGNGSHKHKDWYAEMTSVDYIKFDESTLCIKQRRLLEQALSIVLKPFYYK